MNGFTVIQGTILYSNWSAVGLVVFLFTMPLQTSNSSKSNILIFLHLNIYSDPDLQKGYPVDFCFDK